MFDYFELPVELMEIMLAHYRLTGINSQFCMLDTAEWQLRCPIPCPDDPIYDNEIAYYVNWRPGIPLRYCAGEAYVGSSSDWELFVSPEKAVLFTQETFKDFFCWEKLLKL